MVRARVCAARLTLNYPIAQLPNSSFLPGTFDLLPASVILDSDDLTGRQRVSPGKRAAEKKPHYFGNGSYSVPGDRWLVEPLLAGKAYRRQILFFAAEARLRNGLRNL